MGLNAHLTLIWTSALISVPAGISAFSSTSRSRTRLAAVLSSLTNVGSAVRPRRIRWRSRPGPGQPSGVEVARADAGEPGRSVDRVVEEPVEIGPRAVLLVPEPMVLLTLVGS